MIKGSIRDGNVSTTIPHIRGKGRWQRPVCPPSPAPSPTAEGRGCLAPPRPKMGEGAGGECGQKGQIFFDCATLPSPHTGEHGVG